MSVLPEGDVSATIAYWKDRARVAEADTLKAMGSLLPRRSYAVG